jgi:hypothetical protein
MRNEQLGSISEKEKKKRKRDMHVTYILSTHFGVARCILHNSIPANSQIVVCIVDKYLKNKYRPLIKK